MRPSAKIQEQLADIAAGCNTARSETRRRNSWAYVRGDYLRTWSDAYPWPGGVIGSDAAAARLLYHVSEDAPVREGKQMGDRVLAVWRIEGTAPTFEPAFDLPPPRRAKKTPPKRTARRR